jgi:type II secretory pathway pseudopilin PulG
MRIPTRIRNGKSQRGMSLVELMLAMTMLTVGLGGVLVLITTSIASNNRNKLDTGATLVAQSVIETISAQNNNASVATTDCGNNAITINTAGGAAAGNAVGATLTADGRVDFTQAQSGIAAGYKTNYVTCGPAGGQITYDVRWNVRTINTFSKMVTVSARQIGATNTSSLRFFQPPVTLRTIAVMGN